FRRAFADAPDRVLVIKLIDNGADRARQQLDAAIAGASNIRLIEGALPQSDMSGLMAAADIVISLHRSEGFGLVLAQAMALGKPVVATGWSGNLDFMNERNSALVSCSLVPVHDPDGLFGVPDQEWADADVDHAAEWLRKLAHDAELRGRLGAAARTDIGRQLSPKAFAKTVTALLNSR
ncbi:MAG TPA: glycosyltransferase, partial [Pseudolabrys sp.]|nr:glycosyltransferase [Pseudolabrys sp.]